MEQIIDVIIPAFNEEKSIGIVVDHIPKNVVRNIVVCNNLSTDRTKEVAETKGAIVIDSTRQGYGTACLSGMDYISTLDTPPDIIVFMDGDYSDHPEEMIDLVKPIIEEDYDLVIGSRTLGKAEKGSLTPQQVFGNWLATNLISTMYGIRYTDLGPFRAIKWQKLLDLDMQDKDYGWTVEMQIKAARKNYKITEVPVNYKKRIGVSKVSGTVKGTILAGNKIIWTIFKYC